MSEAGLMFSGVAIGLFLPLLDAAAHRLAIKLFGEFKDKI